MRIRQDFLNTNWILKYKEDSEYVPLSSLYLPEIVNNGYEVRIANEEIKQLYELTKQSSLSKFLNLHSIFSHYYTNNIEDTKRRLNRELSKIEAYLSDSTIDLGINADIYENWGDRRGLLKYVSGKYINSLVFRNIRTGENYYLGHMFACKNLGNETNSKPRPMFTMVVKREYVDYVKLCYILGKQPKGEVFEFWITKDFDTPRTQDKYLRSHVYRKHIKPILLEKNIPIVEKDNWLDDIYKIVKQPVVKTLRDRKEWLNSISKDFTNYLNPQQIEVTTVEDRRTGRVFVTGTGSNSDWNMQDVRELFYSPSTRDLDNQEYIWPVWENPIIPSESYIAGIDPIDSNREVATWRVNPF